MTARGPNLGARRREGVVVSCRLTPQGRARRDRWRRDAVPTGSCVLAGARAQRAARRRSQRSALRASGGSARRPRLARAAGSGREKPAQAGRGIRRSGGLDRKARSAVAASRVMKAASRDGHCAESEKGLRWLTRSLSRALRQEEMHESPHVCRRRTGGLARERWRGFGQDLGLLLGRQPGEFHPGDQHDRHQLRRGPARSTIA